MPELRTPVMIVVNASWEDAAGVLQTAPARMEDKSANGACIRLRKPIEVGTRLRVQWRYEQFSGVVKYCRSDGRDFVVGVQKESKEMSAKPAESEAIRPRSEEAVLLPPQTSNPGARRDRIEEPVSPAPTQIELIVRVAPTPVAPLRAAHYEREFRRQRRPARSRAGPSVRRLEAGKNEIPVAKEAGTEKKPMKRKWLDLASWHGKQENQGEVNGERRDEPIAVQHSSVRIEGAKPEKEIFMSSSAQPAEKNPVTWSREVPQFQIELLPIEEVFRAAGVITPRKGYGVAKAVEMINSEHIRGLSKEMKRAAVLMALDAAGITFDQIQRDAKARQDALDAYESAQKKQADAEWARKAEEITQIQSELESIKAHYTARIGRCTEALSRDKARFNSWVTMKEQESRSMAEALELCLQASVPESTSVAMASAAAAGVGGAVVSAKP